MAGLIRALLERPMSGEAIEAASMAAIERECPYHGLAAAPWAVARRLVHCTADFSLVPDIHFHPRAVAAGIAALRAGAPIYADAAMIRSGLSLARLRAVNPGYGPDRLLAHVGDPDVAAQAAASGLPRSYHAIRKAGPVLDGALVAIGNAPVALLELNRMIAEDGLRPALVIAMPVGFVHVVESKEELIALGVPAITLRGRRGGSPLAVAAIHALAGLALEDCP
jgi:precorrin isomerase